MTIIDLLKQNSEKYGNDTALVEINPELNDGRRFTWREYDLVQSTERTSYRREISWSVFNEKANRVANALFNIGSAHPTRGRLNSSSIGKEWS